MRTCTCKYAQKYMCAWLCSYELVCMCSRVCVCVLLFPPPPNWRRGKWFEAVLLRKKERRVEYVDKWQRRGRFGMKVIRHAGVDSRMIILDDQARQQMTLHFQLSLQCKVSQQQLYIAVCLMKPVMGKMLH